MMSRSDVVNMGVVIPINNIHASRVLLASFNESRMVFKLLFTKFCPNVSPFNPLALKTVEKLQVHCLPNAHKAVK